MCSSLSQSVLIDQISTHKPAPGAKARGLQVILKGFSLQVAGSTVASMTPRELNHRGSHLPSFQGQGWLKMQVLPAGQRLLLPSSSALCLFHLTFRTPITGSGNPRRVCATDIAHTLKDSTMVSPQVQPGHQHGGGPIFPSFLHHSNFLALQNLKAPCPHLISQKPEARGSRYRQGLHREDAH